MGYTGLEQKETYEKLKIELDIVSDTGILTMLLLVMITKMIILLLVLLLLLLTTNESSNSNSYNNINVLISGDCNFITKENLTHAFLC